MLAASKANNVSFNLSSIFSRALFAAANKVNVSSASFLCFSNIRVIAVSSASAFLKRSLNSSATAIETIRASSSFESFSCKTPISSTFSVTFCSASLRSCSSVAIILSKTSLWAAAILAACAAASISLLAVAKANSS